MTPRDAPAPSRWLQRWPRNAGMHWPRCWSLRANMEKKSKQIETRDLIDSILIQYWFNIDSIDWRRSRYCRRWNNTSSKGFFSKKQVKGDTNRILWVGTLDLELVRWSMMDRLNHTAWKQSKQSSVYPRFQFIPRLNWIFENLQGEQFLLCLFLASVVLSLRSKDSTETPRRHVWALAERRSRPTFECGSGMKETPDRQVHLICPDPGIS